MKLINVMTELWCKPCLIMPQMHKQICQIVGSHLDGSAHLPGGRLDTFQAPEAREGREWCEMEGRVVGTRNGMADPGVPAGVAIMGDVACIFVHGVVAKRVAGIENASGLTDTTNLEQAIKFVEAEDGVAGVLFDIDSPGGTTTGTPEVAEMIAGMEKPTVAYTDSLIASAAYWLASQCDAVYASQSAHVGSVGVYMAWLDCSRAYEMSGLKTELIKAGKFKATGLDGVALTEDQRALLQDEVDKIMEWFKFTVRAGRGSVRDEAMEGQVFLAADAVGENLIDAVGSLGDAVGELRSMIGGSE